MKDLKDYITEAIKPPRLSAKNKDLWNNGLIDEKGIWEWLEKNIYVNCTYDLSTVHIVNGKIDVEGDVLLDATTTHIPYPFGTVKGDFLCSIDLKSLNNIPKVVTGDFYTYKKFKESDIRKICKVQGSVILF